MEKRERDLSTKGAAKGRDSPKGPKGEAGWGSAGRASEDAKGEGFGSSGPGDITTSGFLKGLLGLIKASEVMVSESND